MPDERSEQEYLDQLQEYKDRELEIVREAEARRHQVERQYSELTRKVKKQNLAAEMTAFHSAAGSMAKSLGLGIKQQAMIMIPFEIAEATKEMADFLATKDPTHLAASLKHMLAVKQYADAAKAGAPASGGGGGSSGAGSSAAAPGPEQKESVDRRARVVVNVGDGVVINPKEFTRKLVEGLNEAYRDNVRIEFA